MKTAIVLAALLFSGTAYAEPVCGQWQSPPNCSHLQRIWESAYSTAFVVFFNAGYDANAAGGLAEGRADIAVATYQQRHK